jgi:cytochrome P450
LKLKEFSIQVSVFSIAETACYVQKIPFVCLQTFFKFTSRYRKAQKYKDFLYAFHDKIIKERRSVIDGSETENNIFIDLLLNSEGRFTDKEILHQVLTFLVTGKLHLKL